jgi:hypothetical protein
MGKKYEMLSECCQAGLHWGLDKWYCNKCGKPCEVVHPSPQKEGVCLICKGTGTTEVMGEDGIFIKSSCPACQKEAVGADPGINSGDIAESVGGKAKEIDGKCKHPDCIHYGEICCSMCDGEEWYNKMPDGEIVNPKGEGVDNETAEKILPILSNLIINSDYKGYIENVTWAVKEIQSLLSQQRAEARKEFGEYIITWCLKEIALKETYNGDQKREVECMVTQLKSVISKLKEMSEWK